MKNKELLCYVDVGFLDNFIERERQLLMHPNSKLFGKKTYIENEFHISYDTYLNIQKTGIITATAMNKLLMNNKLKQELINNGFIKEIVLDLF